MKNLKLLSFGLLFGILILAGCEKANTEEQYACESDETCPVEGLTNSHRNYEEETVEEEMVSNQPMMRKIMVNEDATPEEIEAEMTETCANIGGTWSEGSCILEDGTTVMF